MNRARDLLLASLLSVLALPASGQEPTLVVENGRVIVGDGTVLERGSVVIQGNRIVSVTGEVIEAPAARRIDASGKTVLPGLIDAHVHLIVPPGRPDSTSWARFLDEGVPGVLRDFVRNGVTTVRSTGDIWPEVGDLRDRVAAGELAGPRIVAAGPVLTAEGAHPVSNFLRDCRFCRREAREVTDPKEAREAVRGLAGAGVDYIKVISDSLIVPVQIDDAVVEAIVDQAHREGLRVSAHAAEAEFMKAYAEMGVDGFVHMPQEDVSRYDPRELARVLARYETPVTTTLSLYLFYLDSPVGPVLEGASSRPENIEVRSEHAAVLAESGVPIVVGTDWAAHPASRHDHPALGAGAATVTEMLLLRWGGMSRASILQAATVNAADALDMSDQIGTLEAGKLADLIVVDGNPLEDLSALRNVELVVKDGKVVVPTQTQQAAVDSAEAAVEAALHGYFAAFKAQDRETFEPYVTDDFLLYEGGYPVEKARFVETWDPSSPIDEDHQFHNLEIDVFGDVASLSYVLTWLREGEVRIQGRETALARNLDGQWKFVRFHSSWFPPIRPMEPATLDDYVGTYERCVENQEPECFRLRVWLEVDNLFIGRADGEPWIAGLRRLELFPAGEDRFYLEVATDNVEMTRDERGKVTGMAIHFSIQNETLRFERLDESAREQR